MDDERNVIIWARPEVTGRGKAPAYTRGQIAKAAVTLADAHGIEAVSMRHVAAEIGSGTMSLYRYVHGKDELHELMVDYVSEPLALPDDLDWRDTLRELAVRSRQLVLTHPWYPVLEASVAFPGPRVQRAFESFLAHLDGLGLDIDEMLEIAQMARSISFYFAQNEMQEEAAIRGTGLDRRHWMLRFGPYVKSVIDSGEFPYLSRVVIDARTPHLDADVRFERIIDRFIAGVAATLPGKPADPGDDTH
ncbi:MAG TPA: TetR/AcrR family transcriptional regulator [Pseudonocardiaceae bacterium]